jgi:hypothetical protein
MVDRNAPLPTCISGKIMTWPQLLGTGMPQERDSMERCLPIFDNFEGDEFSGRNRVL